MKRILLICFYLPVISLISQTEISISQPHCLLKGTLLEYKDTNSPEKKWPLVIITAGSGNTDRNGGKGFTYYWLANQLYKDSISTFRYDKRGIGESEDSLEDWSKIRFENMFEDLIEIVNYFKAQNKFSGIFLAGHSEGSLVAILAAQKTKVNGLISLAGAGFSANIILREQIKKNVVHPVYRKRALRTLSKLEKGQLDSNVDIELYGVFKPEIQPYLISWMKYKPTSEIRKLKIPILVVQGNKDMQVPEKNGEELYAASKNGLYLLVPNMNHVLKEIKTDDKKENTRSYFNRELQTMPELTQVMKYFIQKNKP